MPAGAPAARPGSRQVQPAAHETNVKSFEVRGDSTDNTARFSGRRLRTGQAASTVYAPPGRYLFRGVLSIPRTSTPRLLRLRAMPQDFRDRTQPKPGDDGTALLAAGRGKEDGDRSSR